MRLIFLLLSMDENRFYNFLLFEVNKQLIYYVVLVADPSCHICNNSESLSEKIKYFQKSSPSPAKARIQIGILYSNIIINIFHSHDIEILQVLKISFSLVEGFGRTTEMFCYKSVLHDTQCTHYTVEIMQN